MPEYDNATIAGVLDDFGDLLEIAGADRYRTLSYHKAAHAIRAWDTDITRAAREGTLTEIPGVGAKLASAIYSIIYGGGTFPEFAELAATLPPSIVELIRVPGLGPKRARQLYEERAIASVDDLEQALADGRLDGLAGFGHKTVESMNAGIARYRAISSRILLADALPLAEKLVEALAALPFVAEASCVGSIRRMKETVGDVSVLVASADAAAVMDALSELPSVTEVIARGETTTSVRTTSGRPADVHVVTPQSWGAALQYFTGSAEHNVAMRDVATSRGLRISEQGVWDADDARLPSATEGEVYEALGMAVVPPEIRENAGEIERALTGTLPSLITRSDIRGDLHCHTPATDGKSTIEKSRARAAELGYAYLGCSDHAYDLRMVGGLDLGQLEAQWAEIDALNAAGDGPVLLKAIELNINDEGDVDYPPEVLARFDYCIASLHHGFGQPREKAMRRLLRAMENPWVDIIGHPTGRLLGKREPFDLDMEAVIAKAAETGTALELNAHPERLDLNDRHLRIAMEAGVDICIDTDAHDASHFNFMRWGIATARRGWVTPDRVLNAQPLEELRRRLKRNRSAEGA